MADTTTTKPEETKVETTPKTEEVAKVEEPAKKVEEAAKEAPKEEEKKPEPKPVSSASATDDTPDVNTSDEYKTLEEGEDVLYATYVLESTRKGHRLAKFTIFASFALQLRDPQLCRTRFHILDRNTP